jgi:transaldolase
MADYNNSCLEIKSMRMYLNSCNIAEIQEIAELGILGGVTMNPSMMAELNTDFVGHLQKICEIVDVPVMAQVVSENTKDIIKEAKALSSINERIIVKIQMRQDGIAAMKILADEGIKVCATGVHSIIEAITASQAGVNHVAIFIGLLGEVDENPTSELISKIRSIYDRQGSTTKLMGAVRSVNQLVESAVSGADETTCSYAIWKSFFNVPHTVKRWEKFISAWRNSYGDMNWLTGYSNK